MNLPFKTTVVSNSLFYDCEKIRILQVLFVFLLLISCNYNGQEKITKLSTVEKKIILNNVDRKLFEVQSIQKRDSLHNKTVVSYYDGYFSFYKKELFFYSSNKKLELRKKYEIESQNRNKLKLLSENKFTYSEMSKKVSTKVWEDNESYIAGIVSTQSDNNGKPLLIEYVKYFDEGKDSILVKEKYQYTFDETQNSNTICKEEYNSSTTPSTFKTCVTNYYKDGKIYKSTIGGATYYIYDSKNRLIEKNEVDKSGNNQFQYLYLYDDVKKSMEYQVYRFDESKFLVRKEQIFYNDRGLIKKILYFDINENDKMLPEHGTLYFYNCNSLNLI